MGLFGSSGVVLSHKIFLDFDHTKMLRELWKLCFCLLAAKCLGVDTACNRTLPGCKGKVLHKADNLSAICVLIVERVREPRRVTVLGAYTARFIFSSLPKLECLGSHSQCGCWIFSIYLIFLEALSLTEMSPWR
jgi:hypothetical protein